MKLRYCILLFISVFTLTSCSESMAVLVRIFGLDAGTDKLEIGFDFRRFTEDQQVAVSNIKIYRNDSLLYELASGSGAVSHWTFPEIPDGFRIRYPENAGSITGLRKSDKLRFVFKGMGKYAAYGSWNYEPRFPSPEYRWLFDEEGNKKVAIDCYYEPWIGKDIIKVVSGTRFHVDKASFRLYDKARNAVEFEVKTKKELTNRIALVLKRDLKKGEVLFLSWKVEDDKQYEQEIVVTDRSTIGLAGKFSDL